MTQRARFISFTVIFLAAACERPTMPTRSLDPTVPSRATSPGPTLLSETTWGGVDADVTEGAAVASDGSSYLTGITRSFGGTAAKLFAVKLAANGSLAWQRTWDGPSSFIDDRGNDVTVASDGSVYVTGSTFVSGNGALLLKFGSDGSLIWQRTWGGNAFGQAVAVAADGSVYVTGATRTFGAGEEDLFLIKLTSAGSLVWFKTWGNAAANEEGQGVAVGPDGNVYVAGVAPRANDPFQFQFDAVVLKVDPAGNVIWQRAYAGGDVTDARGGIALAADGSIYVGGGFQGPSGSGFANDALLLKLLAADGSLVWDKRWGGNSGDFAEAAAVAPDGNIAFVGSTDSFGQGGGDDAFLLRVAPSGKVLDASTWGTAGLENGMGVGVAPDGTISVGGTTESPPPYVFAGAPTHTSKAKLSVSTPVIALVDASGVLADPAGVVETPTGSTTYAGSFDAALVRVRP